MNWTWDLRASDGAMNGLEFARCTTAGNITSALVHAAPAKMSVRITDADGALIAKGDADRTGEYSPMTLLVIHGEQITRSEVWPDSEMYGLAVLLAGGEVGVLTAWTHSDDHSWWQWSIEFSNHVDQPADWAPPGSEVKRS